MFCNIFQAVADHAGLVPMESVGVFRSAKSTQRRSPLVFLTFLRRLLACLTAASALPLVCWCPGLPGLCLKPQSLAKVAFVKNADHIQGKFDRVNAVRSLSMTGKSLEEVKRSTHEDE